MQFGFSPYALRPVAVAALALWLALLADGRRPFALSYAFGFGWFGIGSWWLAPTFHHYGHLPWPLAIAAQSLAGGVLALFPALLGWSAVRLAGGRRSALLLLIAPLTPIEEWLRGHLFTGLPWTGLGLLTLDTPWIGWGQIVGGLGLGIVPVMLAAAAAGLLHHTTRRTAAALLAAALLLTATAPAIGVPAAPALRVALIQPNIPQDVKWDRDWLVTTMRRLLGHSAQAADADLLVWPEAATPFFLSDAPGWRQALASAVTRWHTPLLFGGLKRTAHDGAANGAWLMRPGDAPPRFVGKHHLVPFGEYVPAWLPWLHTLVPEIGDFRPTHDRGVLAVDDRIRIGVLICYESIFADEMRRRIAGGADLLAVLTNDAWYGRSPAAWQHLEAARMRAVESERFVLRAANTGVSAIIAPDGAIRATTDWWRQATVTGTAVPIGRVTPYCRLGDAPLLAAALLMVVVTTWRFRSRTVASPA
ncbi:MAG: apolipoprotein N-acyltransferase [Zetaproteobacteria bacterium]|nr:MAG: apolipoprotein N-acyltransferase [Zetaproteobacteria bacterium]